MKQTPGRWPLSQTACGLISVSFILLGGVFATAAPRLTAEASGSPSAPAHTLTGDFSLHPRFHSKFLRADRNILVYLPPGYNVNEKRRYPVLYLQDGQNLFDGATSFIPGQEWRVDETATDLMTRGVIAPLIIVGIDNVGNDRIDEYTPTKAKSGIASGHGGEAALYGRMLTEELKPYIDSHYRTRPDAAHTGLGGSSLGGLVALSVGLQYPKTFGRLACVSVSAWWDDRVIVKQVRALPAKLPPRIWLDIGSAEDADSVDAVRDLRDALVAKGWKPDQDLHYVEAPGAQHNEAAWAERVGPLLTFLFPKE
jgi:predicted alpha/beta superfamily hydrolase